MEVVKLGLIGLGRLGKKYAEIISARHKNAEITAVCSIVADELDYAKYELGVNYVFSNHNQLLEINELDAVMVLSSTQEHARHMIDTINAGLHVFCEKPLALSVDDCLSVIKAAESKPSQTSVVGFVRRYDKSYLYAKEKVAAGAIGTPILFRSQTVDKDSSMAFQKNYVQRSGGIFLDYNVHDIDLARWFLGAEFSKVYAMGGTYKHQVFADMGDADNVMTVAHMSDGTMCHIMASRTATHGHDTYSEITGTEGTLRIGRPAGKNMVEIYDQYGARKEIIENFYERFEDAFVAQIDSFITSVQRGEKMRLSLHDSLEATRVAVAMTKSFMLNKEVLIER